MANHRPQPWHKAGRSETWLWVTPITNQMTHKTNTDNIFAKHQTNVKNRHQINVQGDNNEEIARKVKYIRQWSSVS